MSGAPLSRDVKCTASWRLRRKRSGLPRKLQHRPAPVHDAAKHTFKGTARDGRARLAASWRRTRRSCRLNRKRRGAHERWTTSSVRTASARAPQCVTYEISCRSTVVRAGPHGGLCWKLSNRPQSTLGAALQNFQHYVGPWGRRRCSCRTAGLEHSVTSWQQWSVPRRQTRASG